MNVRRFCRLCCMTVASLFWASCGGDSSSPSAPGNPEPGSSTDTEGNSSSSEILGVSSSEEPSSSEQIQSSSSSEAASLSSAEDLSSGEISSSSSAESFSSSETASSSSSAKVFKLASDNSVTCEKGYKTVSACPSSGTSYDCMDYQKFLATDTTVSEKILNAWEEKLESCGAIRENVALYGIIAPVCTGVMSIPEYKCSNGSSYTRGVEDGDLFYTSRDEYNVAHGISSSSAEESSSSQVEDLVQNCPHGDFALFVDVLADVHKKLYNEIVSGIFYEKYEVGEKIPDAGKQYIESLLDHENESLKGKYTPYFDPDYDYDEMMTSLRGLTNFWFDGYVAKTETCEDGTSKTVQLYLNHYNSIYGECAKMIREKAMSLKDPA